jgi:hypothetical protein
MSGTGEIFALSFVTLEPLKVIGPFAQQTHRLGPAAARGMRWEQLGQAAAVAAIRTFTSYFLERAIREAATEK